ncbi:MAG: hypothetical protein RR808_09830, partial [Akkermansia sp.]
LIHWLICIVLLKRNSSTTNIKAAGSPITFPFPLFLNLHFLFIIPLSFFMCYKNELGANL